MVIWLRVLLNIRNYWKNYIRRQFDIFLYILKYVKKIFSFFQASLNCALSHVSNHLKGHCCEKMFVMQKLFLVRLCPSIGCWTENESTVGGAAKQGGNSNLARSNAASLARISLICTCSHGPVLFDSLSPATV